MRIELGDVYRDAWQIYRLLFRRSVVTAAIVYALISLLDALSDLPGRHGSRIVLGLVAFVLDVAGPVFVQGSLVEIVRNIHEGRRPERVRALYAQAMRRLGSLVWASIVYGLGVILGLLLLVIPGLLAAARWCLMAPLIMLEDLPAGLARARSSGLVHGRTGVVLAIVVVTFLLLDSPGILAAFALPNGWVTQYLVWVLWSSLTAPFGAHVLTVIYYRLTDPQRPVIHEDVSAWGSVWEAA